MTLRKRRADNEDVTRRDRVAVVNEMAAAPSASLTGSSATYRRNEHATAATPAPGRSTPTIRSTRYRPRWHTVVGALILVSAVAVVIVNELELTVLPGSHSEAYLFLSAAVAGYGMWWLGWFDDGRSLGPTDRDAVRRRL